MSHTLLSSPAPPTPAALPTRTPGARTRPDAWPWRLEAALHWLGGDPWAVVLAGPVCSCRTVFDEIPSPALVPAPSAPHPCLSSPAWFMHTCHPWPRDPCLLSPACILSTVDLFTSMTPWPWAGEERGCSVPGPRLAQPPVAGAGGVPPPTRGFRLTLGVGPLQHNSVPSVETLTDVGWLGLCAAGAPALAVCRQWWGRGGAASSLLLEAGLGLGSPKLPFSVKVKNWSRCVF